jgi:heme-degrading monooxygenase HmoA
VGSLGPGADMHGPVFRLLSFKVPVRTQSEFLREFDALVDSMRLSRGFLGDETFLGGRNPRHVVLLSAWSSKRLCEAFFLEAAAPPTRKRLVFRYLDAAEFFRSREAVPLMFRAPGVRPA